MEDFEITNAAEWDLSAKRPPPVNIENVRPVSVTPMFSRRERRVQRPREHRPAPNFSIDPDNAATSAWRRREDADGRIRIPRGLDLAKLNIERIAAVTGTHIMPSSEKTYGEMRTLLIWGNGNLEQVEVAKDSIKESVEELRGKKNSEWAKLPSLNPAQRRKQEKKLEENARRQRYRQAPPDDAVVGAVGFFVWPEQEYRPEDVLGISYEAFDPIRMSTFCYIIYDRSRSSSKVMGNDQNVQRALLRVRATCFQVTARQITPVRTYLLQPLEEESMHKEVYLLPYQPPRPLSADSVKRSDLSSPRLCGPIFEGDELRMRLTLANRVPALNAKIIKDSVMKTLTRLRWYRGHLHMCIRLGTFLVTRSRTMEEGSSWQLGDFENMITESQFSGRVTQELGDPGLEKDILTRFQNASPNLLPQETHIGYVRPIYTGIFIIASGDDSGDYRLEASWKEYGIGSSSSSISASDHTFEVIAKKWSKHEKGQPDLTTLLDISETSLATGRTWHWDISAAQPIDDSRLPAHLLAFADNLSINPARARNTSDPRRFIVAKPSATVHVRSWQQRTAWRFNFAGCDYAVEVARVQHIDGPVSAPSRIATAGNEKRESTVYEPRYAVTVWHNAWEVLLAELGMLEIGEGASWKADAETWFPSDSDRCDGGGAGEAGGSGTAAAGLCVGTGFEELREKLAWVEKCVVGFEGEEGARYMGMSIA